MKKFNDCIFKSRDQRVHQRVIKVSLLQYGIEYLNVYKSFKKTIYISHRNSLGSRLFQNTFLKWRYRNIPFVEAARSVAFEYELHGEMDLAVLARLLLLTKNLDNL